MHRINLVKIRQKSLRSKRLENNQETKILNMIYKHAPIRYATGKNKKGRSVSTLSGIRILAMGPVDDPVISFIKTKIYGVHFNRGYNRRTGSILYTHDDDTCGNVAHSISDASIDYILYNMLDSKRHSINIPYRTLAGLCHVITYSTSIKPFNGELHLIITPRHKAAITYCVAIPCRHTDINIVLLQDHIAN